MARPVVKVKLWDGSAFDDYGTSCLNVTIRRGRQRQLERHAASTCTVQIVDTTGVLDPTASGWGGYAGPDTFGYVEATLSGGADTTLFAGRVDDWQVEWWRDAALVTITFSDAFKSLANHDFPTHLNGIAADDIDDILHEVVNSITGGDCFSDGTGGQAVSLAFTGSALEGCLALADQADGEFFDAMSNDKDSPLFWFAPRDRRFKASVATFTDNAPSPTTSYPYDESSLILRTSDDFIRNHWTVTAAGFTAQEASDAASITAHFQRDGARSTYHTSAAAASVLAQELVVRFADPPAAEFAAIVLEPDAEDDTNLWDLVLKMGFESLSSPGIRFGDRITVVRTTAFGSVTRECTVTGFEHNITPIGDDRGWTTTIYLADAEASTDALILNDATAGKLNTGRLG